MSAELYHLHHQNYLEDIPFWKNLAAQYSNPILELGCGTGRVTLPLNNAGYEITGVDLNNEMLTFMKTEIKLGSSIEIIHEDFTKLNLDKKYPLIIMPCNTYSTLSNNNRNNVLEKIDQHLMPGGAFSFSMPNPAWMLELPEISEPELEDILIHPTSGDSIQVSSAWQNDRNKVSVYWHYDQLLSDGQVKRTTAQTHHFLNTVSVYVEELEKLGFSLKKFGDFESSPYTIESDYLIIVAIKN